MRFDSGLYAHGGQIEGYPWIEEWRAEARLYEQAGFTTVWSAEHHFFWDGWVTPTPSNPVLACADLAAHTSTLRLGQCGVSITDRHPVHVAEDIAMLDHMSKGRVDFGVIRGINNRVSANFNRNADRRDQKKNYALFEESLDIILKCWTEEAFNHAGEFYTLPVPGWHETVPEIAQDRRYNTEDGELIAVGVHPKPFQKPHPPIWQMPTPQVPTPSPQAGDSAQCHGDAPWKAPEKLGLPTGIPHQKPRDETFPWVRALP